VKLESIVKRINIARKSKIKYLLPYDNFLDKIHSAGALVDFTEEQKASKETRLEARKYFVIVCVSAMETYFKRTAQVFIDSKWINDDFLSILKQDKISLADLLEINKKELSLGEIISVSYSFQDLESVDHIYSKMLGVKNFLKKVEIFDVEINEGQHAMLKNDFPDFRKKIGELINLRHLIVHHEGFKGILGLQRLYDMGENLVAFVAIADAYILQKVPED
jgi:hypothetical protein